MMWYDVFNGTNGAPHHEEITMTLPTCTYCGSADTTASSAARGLETCDRSKCLDRFMADLQAPRPVPAPRPFICGPVDEPALMAYHINARHAIMGIGGDIYAACMALLAQDDASPRIEGARRFMNSQLSLRFGGAFG